MNEENQNKVHNPHDKMIKITFSDLESTKSVFKSYLPESLTNLIDWSSLRRINKEFIDEEFKESSTDLLYLVKLKNSDQDFLLYFLFEHQSQPEKWIRLRLLKYECKIWDDSFNDFPKQKSLKPIIPVIIYQGKDNWNHSCQFLDLIEYVNINVEYLPRFSHFLIDQSGFEDEQIKGDTKARIAQLLMKLAFHGKIEKTFRTIIHLLTELENKSTFNYFQFYITYLLETNQEISIDDIIKVLDEETNKPNLKEDVMTAADKLRMEGKKEGEKEGLLKVVKNLLNMQSDWSYISKVTGMCQEEYMKLSEKLANKSDDSLCTP